MLVTNTLFEHDTGYTITPIGNIFMKFNVQQFKATIYDFLFNLLNFISINSIQFIVT